MSDVDPASDDNLVDTEVWQADTDPLLSALAATVMEAPEYRISITLTVSGILVTGELINRSTWAEELIAAFPQAAGAPTAWAQLFREQDNVLDGGVPQRMSYLHIANARTFVGNNFVPTRGGFWRGRISHVSGFAMGQLAAEE